MAKHLIAFGHGNGDTGATHNGLTEATEVRKLKPYLEKWAGQSKDTFEFYNGNMYGDRYLSKKRDYDSITEIHLDAPKGDGGHGIIFRAYTPNDKDRRLVKVIENHFGIVGYLKHSDGFSYRSNLYNLKQAAKLGMTYILLELFFLSNDEDRKHFNDNLDGIAMDLIEAISGVNLKGATNSVKPHESPKTSTPKKLTQDQVANQIVEGQGNWGNNPERAKKLKEQGYDADWVQNRVNDILRQKAKPSVPTKASKEDVAQDIAAGRGGWGNNPERELKLEHNGYDAKWVQSRVNDILKGKTTTSAPKVSKPASKGLKVGDKVTTTSLYANAMSTQNVRKTPITGYVHSINNKAKNPIRLTTKPNGGWLGFTREKDIR